MNSIASLTVLIDELQASGKTVKVTKLPTRHPRKSELVMSMTKGVRTNTNRRGQTAAHATTAQKSMIQGNAAAYFKTSG